MFGLFPHRAQPNDSAVPKAAPGPKTFAEAAVKRLLDQWEATGSFVGAMGESLPRMLTTDGIEVCANPDLLVGITAADTAFGIEIANLAVPEMAELVAAALSPQPHPDWTPALGYESGLCAMAQLGSGVLIRLTCLPCPVDPCFNLQRHAGVRLIGHILPN